ncbi:hypothetical protein COEREDRAFT_87729 [Coemansia reversa NRRL 1564]|uniref:Uncharacterized protein n=1 Tax=Coemansia reversa (strain ATCC 12441 / NRRL 1564) TaxID=763665 RepID=A0A2G5B9Y1_COERN|nr:hypothetical protein COEREDRAFT_87729 [Coemansia reversa NRRL 1564]|eukprot:PIA15537.1 hypothetical protein COEREDRAFT_87729 [Coemansia reversa NRRL 1564]
MPDTISGNESAGNFVPIKLKITIDGDILLEIDYENWCDESTLKTNIIEAFGVYGTIEVELVVCGVEPIKNHDGSKKINAKVIEARITHFEPETGFTSLQESGNEDPSESDISCIQSIENCPKLKFVEYNSAHGNTSMATMIAGLVLGSHSYLMSRSTNN